MARGIRDDTQHIRRVLIVRRILERVTRKKKWSADEVARLVVAGLSPNRVRLGVVGPCFYCFDEFATSVDHIIPQVDGGSDDPWNVVSCCVACNTLKHAMPLSTFLIYHPFGRDIDRARALRKPFVVDDLSAWYEQVSKLRPEDITAA